MEHDITYYAKHRHTVKAFDPSQRISEENIEKVKTLLRLSPSSTNSQPWHFILASTKAGKERIAKATERLYPFNKPSIMNVSHVVVFCSKLDMKEDDLTLRLNQEEKDGRFNANPKELKARQDSVRRNFLNLHQYDYKDAQHWMDKQVYLNLGAFLLGIATLGIEATPMEGIETRVLDEEFQLREQGYGSLVVVPLGYHDPDNDYNAKLPKSRLPYSELFTEV